MAIQIPPIPNNPITDVFVWRDWFYKVSQSLISQASTNFVNLNFSGSNLQSIETRQHNALQAIQGGQGGQYYHLTSAQYTNVLALPTFGTIVTQNLGLTATITTAKLTTGGTNGSMTFVNGILTAQTQAT